MTQTFISTITPPVTQTEPAYWFIFRGNQLLVQQGAETAELPRLRHPSQLKLTIIRQQYLGYLENGGQIHCYSAEVMAETDAPEGMAFQGLRRLYNNIGEQMLWLAGRAIQIVGWDRTHQFCSRCGAPTETLTYERAKKCPQCSFISYPRLSPAVIVRVQRVTENGSEILLARAHHFPPDLYSVLAGFVEPGETLEECVQREIREEVGIEVKDISYFGSQPWPFPNSLMLAFTAQYAGGEFVLEEEEIAEARWFTADALPLIPSPMSISRRLIDDFVRKYGLAVE